MGHYKGKSLGIAVNALINATILLETMIMRDLRHEYFTLRYLTRADILYVGKWIFYQEPYRDHV